MSWTVLVPIKPAGLRKTRLAPRLDGLARERLSQAMLDHVCATLAAVPGVGVTIVARERPADWAGGWHADSGQELNAALGAARTALGGGRIAVCHADLPLLDQEDVGALLAAAERNGIALAPDRAGRGTNAIAVADARPPSSSGSGQTALRGFGPTNRVAPSLSVLDLPTTSIRQRISMRRWRSARRPRWCARPASPPRRMGDEG